MEKSIFKKQRFQNHQINKTVKFNKINYYKFIINGHKGLGYEELCFEGT